MARLAVVELQPSANDGVTVGTIGVPQPRSGHRCCASSNYLYVFGGYNPDFDRVIFRELWCYNISLNRWVEMPNSKQTPFECASSTVALVRGSLFAFGGSGFPFGQTNSSKLLVYSLSKKEWFEIMDASSFSQPHAKYGHGMAYCERLGKLFVHSGTTGRMFTEELHSFDLSTLKWTEIKQNFAPEGRYRHEIVWDRDGFYVVGGSVLEKCFICYELPKFTFDTNEWSLLPCRPCQLNGFPTGRKAHACVLFNNKIYMCGGLNVETETSYDDIWRLDLGTLTWTLLAAKLPQKCYFHSAAVTPHGCLFIFGGVASNASADYRMSKLYKIWLVVPPLVELAWESLLKSFHDMESYPQSVLCDMGIPMHIRERLRLLP